MAALFAVCPPVVAFVYTANFPESVVELLPSALESGVYYGWASIDKGPTYKMVMSIGWNPQFQNEKRSMVSFLLLYYYASLFYSS